MLVTHICLIVFLFFFNDTATTEIYTLSLHDALPIYPSGGLACFGEAVPAQAIAQVCEVVWQLRRQADGRQVEGANVGITVNQGDRKSTRLNSSHGYISYAVFCLKKKKIQPVVLHLNY